MSLIPQPWSKKRGKRFLGVALRGVAGEVAFYAGLFMVGVFAFSLVLLTRFAPEKAPDVSTETITSGLATWILGILSLAAIITGATGLVFRLIRLGASNEFRSVLANRAGSIDVITAAEGEPQKLPSVPSARLLTESPGERLAYRLASDTSPAAGFAGPAILTVLWNTVWFVLLAVVVSGFWYQRPRWIMVGLLVPFAGIGIWSFRYFLAQLRKHAGVGSTIVEISDQPLYPGQPIELFVSQSGRLRLKRVQVQLICEEETFFRQGTDVRVERYEAFREVLHKQRDVRVDPQAPWEQQLSLNLPENAMHSFVGSHNAIRWKIVVSGESRPWPSFCRSFPVVVHPRVDPPKPSPR
tara:strand:- start:24044 stop:25105 length:1062 start_codon:yes stop_codon:yes gene_type:complete